MLQSLELENFKAFGERARIPFAPITLIFGENSAGKSTILQALNLLKQTRESREADVPLLLRGGNEIVDLGSFQELLFNHDLKRTLSIRVEATVDRRGAFRSSYREDKIAIEFSFKRSPTQPEVLLEQIGIYEGGSSECLAEFQPLDPTEQPEDFSGRMRFLHDPRGIPISKLGAVKCVWLTKAKEHWLQEFTWFKNNKQQIRGLLEKRKVDLGHPNEEIREDNNSAQEELDLLENDIDFLFDVDLEAYISKRHSEEMDTILGMQGFFPIRIRSGKKSPWITEFRSFDRRQSDDTIFDVTQLVVLASSTLGQTLEALFPMGPFRRPPERWYIFRGTSPQDVGYRGDLLPDLLFRDSKLDSKLVKETNKWLKQLEIGYKLEVKSVGDRSRDLFEVRLIDIHRKKVVDVALPDVGYGISQLLPFVVQSLIPGKRIISIEQPEVHVHPRLQADIGDLLAEVIIKEPRQKQFIIETHSEHLILRLQRLVYEKKIKPDDVSVIYVSRGAEGAKAQRLRLDEEGDFIDEWPNGFFSERLRELR